MLPVSADRNGPHLVGAQYLNICLFQPFDDVGMRVSVEILEACRDNRERRMNRLEKQFGGRCLAPVVRDFEHVSGLECAGSH